MTPLPITRRLFLSTAAAAPTVGLATPGLANAAPEKAHIALTLDLEMSRHYPRRGLTEWDFQKGNLDEATKAFANPETKELSCARNHFMIVAKIRFRPPPA